MKISGLGEFGAIRRAGGILGPPGREVSTGIGDDAAAYAPPPGKKVLVSADMLLEGVHFDLSCTTFRQLGSKALAANLSDIAAMGGRPRYYLVCLALGKGALVRELDELYFGMEAMAGRFGVRCIGGDTCSSAGPAVVGITVLGDTSPGRVIRRAAARPGDDIYVTGTLGDSAGGLLLLKAAGGSGARGASGARVNGRRPSTVQKAAAGPGAKSLVSRHLEPEPRVKAGMALSGAGLATAMIDISDGLSSDLGHILSESGVGAEVFAGRIPLSAALVEAFGGRRALRLALDGGEDYELLFTARPSARVKISGLAKKAGTDITLIGAVTRSPGAFLLTRGGKRVALRPKGYEHFRK